MPKPDHQLFEAHPSVSSGILDRISHGDIVPKPNIAALAGDRVRFVDGSSEPIDAIIYCTGYKVSFPFFDSNFLAAQDNDLPLFLRMFKPDIDKPDFYRAATAAGSDLSRGRTTSVPAGEYLCGRYALPNPAAMAAAIEQERKKMFHRYVKSKRHTMQVDFDEFMGRLDREMRVGGRRAKARGNRLSISARARAGSAVATG